MNNIEFCCEITLLSLSLFLYCRVRDIFNPAVVVSGLWAVILCLYNHYDHGLYPLSSALYLTITTWAILFSVTSYVFGRIIINTREFSKYYRARKLNKSVYNCVIVSNILLIISLVMYGGGGFSLDLTELRILSVEEKFPRHILFLNYINQFSIVYTLGFIYYYGAANRRKMFVLCVIMLLTLIFKTNKTGFIVFFIGVLYVLKCKKILTPSKGLYIGLLLLGFMMISAVTRGDAESFSWTDYAIIYLLSPLPAMDMVLGNDVYIHYGDWGSATFSLFYKILELFGHKANYSVCNEWVQVPLPTNVYTTLKLYYLDFGYAGIWLFSIILGVIWGIMYRLQKLEDPMYILFYASMLYSLFVQFFGDYFFGFLSVTIQCYIFSFILARYVFFSRRM